ncbi:MAG: tetratricopeptide repeat protein [Cyanobacteria bacterium P01_A01_bin.83]
MSSNREIVNLQKNKSFWESNQQTFKELLTFVDFADDKLNIAFAEINFAQDRDLLIKTLIENSNCKDIQFVVLDFPDPDLRFLRDEIVKALKEIKIDANKKPILLVTGLEKSIGILDEYPDMLVNLNYVRDDFSSSICHPIIFFLPEYALTRLAKYAPDFWAWSRKVFHFKTVKSGLATIRDKTLYAENYSSLNLLEKETRINLLQSLLSEYKFSHKIEKKRELSTVVDLYIELGNAYYSLGEYQQAANCYQQSSKNAQKIKDFQRESYSLAGLGKVYYSLGEYQIAIDFCQQSLAISKKIKDRYGESILLFDLGVAYYSLREYQIAIDFFQKSLTISKKIKDCYGESKSLNYLGNAYSSLREYQRAVNFYQHSLKKIQKIEASYSENIKSIVLSNLGYVYNYIKKYQRAINYFQKSLTISQKISYRKGEAISLIGLGNAYSSLGEYQRAIDFYQQSLTITQQIGNRIGEANSWFNLGNTLKTINENLDAKAAYEDARKLYQTMVLDKDIEACNQAIQELENHD